VLYLTVFVFTHSPFAFGTITVLLGVSGMQSLIGACAPAVATNARNNISDTTAGAPIRRTSNSLIGRPPSRFPCEAKEHLAVHGPPMS
jgi:hypothetical protein